MATVYDIEANVLIEESSKELAKMENIKSPDWAAYVKTGTAKERPPARDDWWFVRAAAILRTIYKSKGPIGVAKLRLKYGSKKNRGHRPEKFFRASGKIIRLIIQQLEKEELIKKAEVGVHKGRIITGKGKSFLDKLASKMVGNKPVKKEEVKAEKKVEVKEEKKEASVDKKKEEPKQEKKEEKKTEEKKEVKAEKKVEVEEEKKEASVDKKKEEVKEEKKEAHVDKKKEEVKKEEPKQEKKEEKKTEEKKEEPKPEEKKE